MAYAFLASDLTALAVHIPIEDLLIPRSAYVNDRLRAETIYAPYATGRRAFGARVPFPISSTGVPRLPRVLREATSFLLTDQNIRTHGLFRVNASKNTVEILAEAYDRGQKFIIWGDGQSMLTFGYWKERYGEVVVKELQCMRCEAFSISAAAGLIKAWYNKLREPIFPQSSYAFLERVFGDQTIPIETSTILDLIGETSVWSPITKHSREILRLHLLPLLAIVAENEAWNEMAPHNLAICFAPNLLLLSGQDQIAGLKVTNVIIRFLQHAIELWDTGLSAACNMDRSRFEQSLRIPESIEDREDPLDHTDPSAPAPTTQSQGVIEFDLEESDDDGYEEEDRPPLPPRKNAIQGTEGGVGHDQRERPPVPPKDAIAQGPGRFPDNASAVRRKPVPPAAPPPRYSWESTPTETLPASNLTGDGRLGAAHEPQYDQGKF
jgi:Rho GTPase-activating protein 1